MLNLFLFLTACSWSSAFLVASFIPPAAEWWSRLLVKSLLTLTMSMGDLPLEHPFGGIKKTLG